MSIQIKLDRPALLALIEKDPEFKFELSNAVVSEVIRKVFEKDMTRLIKEAEPEMFKRAVEAMQENKDLEERIARALDTQMIVRPTWGTMPSMSPALKKMFDEAMLRAVDQLKTSVSKALDEYVTEHAKELVEAKLAELDIDTRIAKRVDRLLNEEVDKRVAQQLAEKIGKINEALK